MIIVPAFLEVFAEMEYNTALTGLMNTSVQDKQRMDHNLGETKKQSTENQAVVELQIILKGPRKECFIQCCCSSQHLSCLVAGAVCFALHSPSSDSEAIHP